MSTDATTLVEAKEWCKEMRGTLKLTRKERGKLDLKSRSADAAENITKLQGKVQPIVYDRLKGELLAVAGRIKATKPTDPRGNLEVDAERLNVLACQSKALLKDDKSSQKDLSKALTSLGQSLVSHSPNGGSPDCAGQDARQTNLRQGQHRDQCQFGRGGDEPFVEDSRPRLGLAENGRRLLQGNERAQSGEGKCPRTIGRRSGGSAHAE